MRDLRRLGTQRVDDQTRTLNRLHQELEDANLKRGSVASNILGVSGRALRQALREGEQNPVKLAEFARRPLRGKIPERKKALEGHLSAHHRYLLKRLGKQLAQQEERIAELEGKIEEQTRPCADEIEQQFRYLG